MAGVKISQLPAVASALTTDFFPVVQGGITSQETLAQVQTLFGMSGGVLSLAAGGTGSDLTASNGGIVYSNASGLAILAGTATANQVLLSGASAAPTFSTATYPATTTVNQLLYSSSANTIAGLATANNAVIITSSAGIPSASQTLPAAVQANITALGTQAQALNMGSFQINAVAAPTLATDAATKGYVDSIAVGGGAPVVAASTVALTVTQAGAGVGATLTNAGAQATFALDGQNPTIGQRVLIKNQSTNTQNGVYIVTSVGSGATNWVLTRAIDYDTPTNINDTGIIPVENGTVNANTGWINTTIMVVVDTTAITFTQFGVSVPVTVPNGGTGIVTTTAYGLIAGGTTATGAYQNVGTGTTSQFLLGQGAAALPIWSSTLPAAVLTNVTSPTTQLLTASSGTYTKPATAKWLEVWCVGPGGGGAQSTNGAAGSAATTFGTTFLVGNPGAGGSTSLGGGGAGGTATGGTLNTSGTGGGSLSDVGGGVFGGGAGGPSGYGCGGGVGASSATNAAGAGTMGGGGGGGASTSVGYAGGGGGGCSFALITSPSSTYSFTVGVGGAAGTTSGGLAAAAGGTGFIFVKEHYI